MSTADYLTKTYAKNIETFMLVVRNPDFMKQVERIRSSWALPLQGYERCKDSDECLSQIMNIFLLRHLPRFILKYIGPLFPNASSPKVLELFNLFSHYIPRNTTQISQGDKPWSRFDPWDVDDGSDASRVLSLLLFLSTSSGASGQMSPELKDKAWGLVENEPNRSETLALGELVSLYLYLGFELFIREILKILDLVREKLGREWLASMMVYVLTDDETLAAQLIPCINIHIKEGNDGRAVIESGPRTTARDRQIAHSILNRRDARSKRHKYPLRNLKGDIILLEKKRIFKTNKQKYEHIPAEERIFVNCFKEPTNFGDIVSKDLLDRDPQVSFLDKDDQIKRIVNRLKRRAYRTKRRIKEKYKPADMP